MDIINKYNYLPALAKWKALILQYGINFSEVNFLKTYPCIENYKTKYKITYPKSSDFEVYDTGMDNSIIPSEVVISYNGESSIVKLRHNNDSPLRMDISNNIIVLHTKFENQSIPIEVNLVQKYKYLETKLPVNINSNAPILNNFIDIVGFDRIVVLPFDGCWNWSCGKACKFCDLHPKREGVISERPSLNTLKNFNFNVKDWWSFYSKEYLEGIKYSFYTILNKERIMPHKHLVIMAGNLPTSNYVWEISEQIISALNDVASIKDFDNYLNICPHPEMQYIEKLKDLGIKQVQYNLEVIGEKVFIDTCPGKISYDLFLKKLEESVQIFGSGNVRSNFVLGVQPIDELLEGIESLANKGIVADYSVFQPKKSTPWENKLSPEMETVVDFTMKLVDIYKKHNFKAIYCNLSSRSSIVNECINI